ncbi:MAG: PAS domain-containing protein, partial [Succinivibrio sp.]
MSEPRNPASADDLRIVLNALPEAVYAFRPDMDSGAPFFVNSVCLRKTEASSEHELFEKCGGNLLSCIHPEDRARAEQSCAASLAGGVPHSIDCRIITLKGNVLMVRMLSRAMRGNDGKDVCICTWLDLGDELLCK